VCQSGHAYEICFCFAPLAGPPHFVCLACLMKSKIIMNKISVKIIFRSFSFFSISLVLSTLANADREASLAAGRLSAIEKRIKAEEKYIQEHQGVKEVEKTRAYHDHKNGLKFWREQKEKLMAKKHLAAEEKRLSQTPRQTTTEVSPERARVILKQEEERRTFRDVSRLDARSYYHNPKIEELEAINQQRRIEIAERAVKIEALKAKIKADQEQAAKEKQDFESFMQAHSGDQARFQALIRDAEELAKKVQEGLEATTKACKEAHRSQ
jgi:hypothetical protein